MQSNQGPDKVPRPPVEPEPADCCGEGCAHCVFDLYEAELAKYQIALAAWRSRQSGNPSELAAAVLPGSAD